MIAVGVLALATTLVVFYLVHPLFCLSYSVLLAFQLWLCSE